MIISSNKHWPFIKFQRVKSNKCLCRLCYYLGNDNSNISTGTEAFKVTWNYPNNFWICEQCMCRIAKYVLDRNSELPLEKKEIL